MVNNNLFLDLGSFFAFYRLTRRPPLGYFLTIFFLFFFIELSFCDEKLSKSKEQPILVDGDVVEYSADTKKVVAEGNVEINYEGARLTCDRLEVDTQTKDAEATGSVRLSQAEGLIETEKLFYNFETQKGNIPEGRLRASPYYYIGKDIIKDSENHFNLSDGSFSPCNYDSPHIRMKSKKVDIYTDDKIIAKSNKLYWLKCPLFYLPTYTHSLKDPLLRVQFKGGKTSEWGLYLLSVWRYNLTEWAQLRLYLDWRENWDFAQGFGVNYDTDIGHGDVKFYYAKDRRRDIDQQYHQEFQRYMGRLRHMWEIDNRTKFTSEYYRIEDDRLGWHSGADFLQDYFYREYERVSNPRTYSLLSRDWDYSNLSLLFEKRTNRRYSTTEKLPEVSYTLNSNRMGDLPFYIENESKITSFNKKYATPSSLDDDVVRVDAYNKITLPKKFMFIETSPFAALRETYYSKDAEGEYVSPRTAFSTGIDMSSKFFRIFKLKSNYLNLDINNLRHLVNPEIKYSYDHRPTVSSTKLVSFDGIDSINGDNRFTLALENKLQTKRSSQVIDLVKFLISSNYIMYSKTSNISKSEDRFTDFLFDLELRPYSWLRVETDAAYNHREDYFTAVNLDTWIDWGANRTLGVGHRYYRGGGKELTTELNWRINPKWSFRVYERYQFSPIGIRGWLEQEYSLVRDMHCATMELTYNIKKIQKSFSGLTGESVQGTIRDEGFFVVFNLKMFKESEFDYAQSYHPPKVIRE